MSVAFDHVFKIVLLGGANVGKTSVYTRYMQGDWSAKTQASISANYLEKTVTVPGTDRKLKIQVWDTAGHERFRTINRIYYRDASAALMVYDVTDRDSLYNEVNFWLKDLQANAPSHCVMGILGNKVDLSTKLQVSLDELQEFALKSNIKHFQEGSAKTNKGINDVFSKIISDLDENKEKIMELTEAFTRKTF